ncbi:MAG: 6-pyruvoyltetrahydropterin/6-carboxytetrahydropterin synthase [Myxococcota bacterium]|jgi:6-pyruvoyltetrahydropterin/6-carboxytetrahydropterin synthase
MYVTLSHTFSFEAARRLTQLPAGHPCGRIHGHSFHVEVVLAGDVNPETGWLIDYAVIADAWKPLHIQLDHHCLNDVEGLSNPTSEHIAAWIWRGLVDALPGLDAVCVMETPATKAIYRGEKARRDA